MLRIGSNAPAVPVDEEIEEPIDEVEEPTEDIVGDIDALGGEEALGEGGGFVDPVAAKYLGPEARCESCIHFAGNSCEVVAGPIDPQGICSIYTPDAMLDEPMVEEPLEAVEEPLE